MRILVDEEEIQWDAAWNIVTNTFFFTNHTVLPVSIDILDHFPIDSCDLLRKRWRSGQFRCCSIFFHGMLQRC